LRPRTVRTPASIFALALAITATALGVVPTLSAAKKSAAVAAPKISEAKASGTTVTVKGRVALPANTAKERRNTRVLLTLKGKTGAVERHTVTISSQRTFKASWRTKLTGSLTLSVRVTIGGKDSGKLLKRTLEIHTAPVIGPAPASEVLVGTFELKTGSTGGTAPTGSYFEMLQPNGAPFPNPSAVGGNLDYTALSPGTDGGLETYAYQPPPSPAFSNGQYGGALASAIVKPVEFYGWNFSIVTSPSDAQLGQQDPLPQIIPQGDKLTGQISDWVAQWNGSSFNQGTPKPDGSSPAPTTALSGTYDAATGAFTLTWQSRIVGGPFNGFAGVWHLAGTFVPEPEPA
jgi:hypothetical protein